MTKNLYQRIEVCVAIKNNGIRKELIDYFEMQWKDNDKAVILLPDLQQKKEEVTGERFNAQRAIYNYLQTKS